jgi:hypothetical protein
MDNMKIVHRTEPRVSLSCERPPVELERAEMRRYTDANQQAAKCSGDRFFEFVLAFRRHRSACRRPDPCHPDWPALEEPTQPPAPPVVDDAPGAEVEAGMDSSWRS